MTLAAATLLAWGATYASTVAWAIIRRGAAPARPPSEPPARRALLVRPCSGDERDLASTLRSSVIDSGGLPAGLVVRFAVASEDDAATPIARSVANELSQQGHDVVVWVTAARGPNRKADQIARVLARAPAHDAVVIADSDVLLSHGDLRALLEALDEPGVAAAWSPPVEDGSSAQLGDVLSRSVLRATLQAFPLLAGLDPAGLVGKLFAVRREALDAAGSFAPLVGYLGEDMELARRLRSNGERVVVRGIANALPRGRTPKDAVLRYARWMGVIRSQRPRLLWTYPLFFFSPLPLAALALLVGGTASAVAAALFAGARLVVALAAVPGRRGPLGQAILEAFLGDAVLAAAFVMALSTRTISWRGVTLRLAQARIEAEE